MKQNDLKMITKTSKLKEMLQRNSKNKCLNANITAYSPKINLLKLIVLTGISLFAFNRAIAQEALPKKETTSVANLEISPSAPTKSLVTGIVKDEENMPLAGANVWLEGSTVGAVADLSGKFKFPKPLQEGDVLVVSFIGYKSENIEIQKDQKQINVFMKTDDLLITCDVPTNTVYKPKRTLWQKVKTVF